MESSISDIMGLTRAAFRQEADDLLSELDSALLSLEAAPSDADALNRAFRAMHTLKGSGATAGFTEISALVHDVEDIFNGARAGRIQISSAIIDLVLKVGDVVRKMLAAPESQGPALLEEGMKVVHALTALVAPGTTTAAATAAAQQPSAPSRSDTESEDGLWAIHFAPEERIFHRGSDPLSILRELLSLGHGVVRADSTRLAQVVDLDPTLCYLSWDLQLATSAKRARLEEVFQFVAGAAVIRIEPVQGGAAWVLPGGAYFAMDMLAEFREEAAEDLVAIEAHLLALEESPGDTDQRDGLKRALHNLKGVSRLVLSDVKRAPPTRHPLRAMGDLCHAAETLLEVPFAPGTSIAEGVLEMLLESVDCLKSLLAVCDEAREDWPFDLFERLGASDTPANRQVPDLQPSVTPHPMVRALVQQCEQVVRALEARLLPGAEPPANDWTGLGRALTTLAKATAFEGEGALAAQARALASSCEDNAADAAESRLSWSVFRERYRAVVVVAQDLEIVGRPSKPAPSHRPRGRTISLHPAAPGDDAARSRESAASTTPAQQRSIRVDQAKLDVLMGAIGELLVAKNALPVLVSRVRASDSQTGKEIKATVDRIAHIADDLQDAMRQIRMMPIQSVFQRFPRMIRDLARSEHKQVQLLLSGEETELDKTVLEQIADPLVHLVRNAVDHGIELPADRLLQSKPEMGTITLGVTKEGSNVVIRISDDGRGMSPERLRAKAVEKGLLSAADAAVLSDRRALDLIFLPGFSTAATVTDISGRGVGMDVVQSNIKQLHGTIAITSEVGRGSVMTIKLPSSLMVSKGMLVLAAQETYVLPIEGIREMVKIRRDQIRQFRGVSMAHIRGSVCSVFSLGALLGLPASTSMQAEEANAAIVATESGTIAIIVDRLVAEIDVIVKPLSGGLDKLALFQGATILGDGNVALVVDLGQLGALASSQGATAAVPAAAA